LQQIKVAQDLHAIFLGNLTDCLSALGGRQCPIIAEDYFYGYANFLAKIFAKKFARCTTQAQFSSPLIGVCPAYQGTVCRKTWTSFVAV
jgi:hypothetical protein